MPIRWRIPGLLPAPPQAGRPFGPLRTKSGAPGAPPGRVCREGWRNWGAQTASSQSEGGSQRRGRGYGPSAPSPFPTSFLAVTWSGAGGGAGARPREEGVREGTQRVGGSAGRCGVTMTTGPEAAREVTGTRLARSHVSGDRGGGAAPGPRP